MGRVSFLLFIVFCIIQSQTSVAQQCNTDQFCKAEDIGAGYDFRGQSTYGKYSPGDTCRVQAVFYSGNDERVLICSDPKLGQVQFRVFKSVFEYKRTITKIEKKETQEPIYKLDKKGKPIPKLDDWGKPVKDYMGDIAFEIASYSKKTTQDTIWKIERKSRDEVLFDSRKGSKIFNTTITKTEPIMIEMVIPKANDAKLKQYKGCVGIMIGRIFHSTNFKTFTKNN